MLCCLATILKTSKELFMREVMKAGQSSLLQVISLESLGLPLRLSDRLTIEPVRHPDVAATHLLFRNARSPETAQVACARTAAKDG